MKEWDTQRERKTEFREEPIKVDLDGSEKTTLVGVELTELEVARMNKLLRKSKGEFVWSPIDVLGLDPSLVVYRLNLNPNANELLQKKRKFSSKR